jgi:hypothetical protein
VGGGIPQPFNHLLAGFRSIIRRPAFGHERFRVGVNGAELAAKTDVQPLILPGIIFLGKLFNLLGDFPFFAVGDLLPAGIRIEYPSSLCHSDSSSMDDLIFNVLWPHEKSPLAIKTTDCHSYIFLADVLLFQPPIMSNEVLVSGPFYPFQIGQNHPIRWRTGHHKPPVFLRHG